MQTDMKFCHSLLLSALVVSPFAVESASARTQVQLYKDLATSPHAVDADANRRAGTYPALAVMPADVEACLAITDINSVNLPFLTIAPGQGLDNPKVKEHVETIAFAIGKGNAADLAAFMPVYQYLAGRVDYPARAEAWVEAARAEYSGIIKDQVSTLARKGALDAVDKLPAMHLRPVYIAVTADVPAHRYLMDVADEYISAYQKQYGGTKVEENGCKGVKIPFTALFDMPEGDATVETAVRKEISSRSLYVMFKQQGGTLVVILCENPQEINVAETPDKSVLSTDALKPYDPYLLSGVKSAAYVSPELINSLTAYSVYDMNNFAVFVTDVFRAMGKEDDSNVNAYSAAATAVKPVLNYCSSYVRTDADKPFRYCVWPQDDGTHVKVSFDAYGSTFNPGNIRLARIATSDKVLFYAESTEEVTENPRKTVDVLEPAIQLLAGYITTLEAPEGGEKLLKYMPRMKTLMRNVRAADKALGDVPAFVVMPLKDGTMALSYFNAVKDRAALGKAGDELVTCVGRMLGGKADFLRKKVKSKTGKSVASHTADMSDLSPGMELNATISSKNNTFAFGNSAALNAQMIKYGTGKINFTGAVYTIRPAALSIATSAAPEATILTPVLEGIGAVHVTNTIKDDERTIHVLLAVPGGEDEEE